MSDIEFIFALWVPLGIIGGFITFAIWQMVARRNSANYTINPHDIPPFKPYAARATSWYIARERIWPPIKIGKISTINHWPFITVERVRDQCGQTSIYKNNLYLLGQIHIYNSYRSFIEYDGYIIEAVPDLADFTNICRSITYVDLITCRKILQIAPRLDIGQTFAFHFKLNEKNYELKSGLIGARLVGELYVDGRLAGIVATITAKQLTGLLELEDIDKGAVLLCFDIFSRRTR